VKNWTKALTCIVPFVTALVIGVADDALARDRSERWEDRRTARRAYIAGAIASHRREDRRERWESRERREGWGERSERSERRESRRDAARAAVVIGVGAAIIGRAIRDR
jgi:hypothetical protein